MNTDNNRLSAEELERLADAFFNCALERSEEASLARVLAFSDIHTPLLDSCRLAMGLETGLKRRRPSKRSGMWRWMPVAASISLLVAVVLVRSYNNDSSGTMAEVYLSGKRITDKNLARNLAQRDMENDLKAFREAMDEASRQKMSTENEIEQTRQILEQINTINRKL